MNEEIRYLKKQIVINRVLLIVLLCFLLLFMFAFLVGGFLVYRMVIELKPMFESLKSIDFNEVANILEGLSSFSDLQNIDINEITSAIESVDFESISRLVNSVDIEEIEDAMESLAQASQMLETVNEKVGPLLSLFGK